MSYASVAASNAPPISEQPQPDPALLNTNPPKSSSDAVVDGITKVQVVPPDYKENPQAYVSRPPLPDERSPFPPSGPYRDNKRKAKVRRHIQEVEAESAYLWDVTKQYLLRPGVAGGLLGLLNIGLLAGAGRAFYIQPHLRKDATTITSTILASLALFTTEGYFVEKYRQTPRGQEEEEAARREGSILYRKFKEHFFRPEVLNGFVGLTNTAVVGAIGYISYVNWDKPSWNRRTVSIITASLLALWGGEGIIAQQLASRRTN